MKSTTMLGMAAIMAAGLSSTAMTAVRADTAAALTGQVTSEAEGAMEGVVVTAHKDGSIVQRQCHHRRQGPLHLPGGPPGAGPLHDGLRAVGYDLTSRDRDRHRSRQDRDRRRQAGESDQQQSRPPAHQCRVDHEHAGHRRAEGDAAQLHQLPHPGTHGALDP